MAALGTYPRCVWWRACRVAAALPASREKQHVTSDIRHDPLAELSAQGVAVWLDDLSRELLASGELQVLTPAMERFEVQT